MELRDVVGTKNLVIQILWGERTIEFGTQAVERYEKGVLISPYVYQGGPLELNIEIKSNIIVNLFADEPGTGHRVSWRNLELQTIYKNKEMFYYISPAAFREKATIDDRRLHKRIVINKVGSAWEKDVNQVSNVRIYDVCDNGISFYAPSSFAPVTNRLTVSFVDTVGDRVFELRVDCSVARTEQKAGNQYYGCRITEANKEYMIYGCLKRLAETKQNVGKTTEQTEEKTESGDLKLQVEYKGKNSTE